MPSSFSLANVLPPEPEGLDFSLVEVNPEHDVL